MDVDSVGYGFVQNHDCLIVKELQDMIVVSFK